MSGRPSNDSEVAAIANEIERYVETHPRSKDSAPGIRNWWLSGNATSVSQETVQRAIDALVQRGVLVEEELPDGGRIYASARVRSPRPRQGDET